MAKNWKIWSKIIILGMVLGIGSGFSPTASASSCKDLSIIYARGSGEYVGNEKSQVWFDEVDAVLERHNKYMEREVSASHYELGSNLQLGYSYPAVSVGFDAVAKSIRTLGAYVDARGSWQFSRSVKEGVNELKTYIELINSKCPDTKFVMGGHSQGAMVLTTAMQDIDPDKILYVAAFGDPQLYLPEGKKRFLQEPEACLGQNYSFYRTFVPDCEVYEGILGKIDPYADEVLQGKVGTWCLMDDLVCGSNIVFGKLLDAHTSYISRGYYAAAALEVLSQVRATYGTEAKKTETTPPSYISHFDMKWVLDLNGISEYSRKEQVEGILETADEVFKIHGRIGLTIWGGKDGKQAVTLIEPTENREAFHLAAARVETYAALDNWEDGQTFETIAHAAVEATEHGWDAQARMLIVSSGAGDPSLEILVDGVPSTLDQLCSQTPMCYEAGRSVFYGGGKTVISDIEVYEEYLPDYNAEAVDEAEISLLSLNDEGVAVAAEVESTEAEVETKAETATVTGIFGTTQDNSATIQIETENSELVAVVLDRALLGLTNEKTITLTNLEPGEHELRLLPYNADGERGEARNLEIKVADSGTTQEFLSGSVAKQVIGAPNTGWLSNPLFRYQSVLEAELKW